MESTSRGAGDRRGNATATVLCSDLVDSTELLANLGEAAFDGFRREHFDALRAALADHGGHEVKTLGDGMLAWFGSAADALSCAATMQQCVDRPAGAGQARIAIRVGLAIGDVSFEDGDVFGTPVVQAARLTAAARGGQILATAAVPVIAGGRATSTCTDLGPMALKGLPEPVPVCEVAWEPLMPEPGRPAPLVGRQRELARARRALDRALAGTSGVVLVSGEPGIGKTRLVQELAGLAEEQGAAVAWGLVDDLDGTPPYWPWIQLLSGVLKGVTADLAVPALAGDGAAIAAIVPAFADLAPDPSPPPPADPAAARFRLHQAIVDFLRRVAADRPLMLILEDLHWGDVSSLELTKFVATRLGDANILCVLTYRDVDAGPSEHFDEALAVLARVPRLERIALAGLDEAEVGRLMAQATGLRSRPIVVAAVHERTEGNPFFVGELARLLHGEGLLSVAQAPAAGTVPAGVRDVVRRRLCRLPAATYELLVLGAVMGREFELAVLGAAAEMDTAQLGDGIESALAAGVIGEVDGAPARLRFPHALIRDTIYGELSTLRRATLHGRVGVALEQRHGPDGPHLAELAWHFFHAAPVVGPEPGLAFTLAAAGAARAALAYEHAEDDLHRALSLVQLLPAGRDRLQQDIEVQNLLAMLLTMTRGYAVPETAEAWTRSRELHTELGNARELLMPLFGLFLVHSTRADHTTAAAIGEQLLELGRAVDDPALLLAGHEVMGVTMLYRGRLGEARQHLEQSRTLTRAFEDSALLQIFPMHPGVMGVELAIVQHLTGDEARCESVRAEAKAVRDRLDQPLSVGPGLVLDLWLQGCRGAIETAPEDAAAAGESCREWRLLELAAMADFWGASARQFRDGGDHLGELTAALMTLEKSGFRILRTQYMAVLAQAHALVGDADQALAVIEQGLTEADRNDERFWEPELLRLRAELLAGDRVRLPHAVESAEAASSLARAQGSVTLQRRAEATLAAIGSPPGA